MGNAQNTGGVERFFCALTMQFNIPINQVVALEWGLNIQQASLFQFLYELSSWAQQLQIDGRTYYYASKAKIVAEIPLVVEKEDTAYRLANVLIKKGLVEKKVLENKLYWRITEKGKGWNRKVGKKSDPCKKTAESAQDEGSEKNPTPGKKSDQGSEKNPRGVGKKSDQGSEKNPTYQYTSNQLTNDQGTNDYVTGGLGEKNTLPALPDKPRPIATIENHSQPMCDDWSPPQPLIELIQQTICPNKHYIETQLISFRAHFSGQYNTNWSQQFKKWINNGWNVYGHKNNFGKSQGSEPEGSFIEKHTNQTWRNGL